MNGQGMNSGSMAGSVTMRRPVSRLEQVRQVEATLVQIQGMFAQFAGVVQEQGEMLEHIDLNVDRSVLYVDDAHETLQRTFKMITKNRTIILAVLGFVLFVVLVFYFFF